jgi:hypothetical protein
MDSEGQPVRFRDCTCPGTPHPDGDVVYLRPVLGFTAGAEALRLWQEAIRKASENPVFNTNEAGELELDLVRYVAEIVGPVYIREGSLGWNVVDDDGAVPCTRQALEALSFTEALPIVEVADDLYSNAVVAPLGKQMSVPSGNGSINKPTRQARRSSARARSPRKSSSVNGSAGLRSVVSP